MKRKSKNRKSVELTLPADLTIGLSESKFKVFDDSGKVGELQVSKGSVVWFPRKGKLGYWMNWDTFNRVMKGGRKIKQR